MKYLIFLSIIGYILIPACQKSVLGETETGFVKDSVYQANSEGLLYVEYLTPHVTTYSGVIIYAGESAVPADTIGRIHPYGSATLPIHQGSYWKVSVYHAPEVNPDYELKIEWTPFS